MTAWRAAVGPLLLLATQGPAAGQEKPAEPQAPPPASGVQVSEAELRRCESTLDLYRCHRDSVVRVLATSRAFPLPTMDLNGVEWIPSGAVAEEVEGTGFVIGAAGFVVTTFSLVRNAGSVRIRIGDRWLAADVAGTDPTLELAVLRVDGVEDLHAIREPAKWNVGEPGVGWFFGAGDRPDDPQVTVLEVCADHEVTWLHSPFLAGRMDLTEGAAGGPLFSEDGGLVGMAVTGIRSRVGDRPVDATLFVEGRRVLESAQAIAAGRQVERPLLGVLLTGSPRRIEVVIPGSPAEKAGLCEGDRLLRIAGTEIRGIGAVARVLLDHTFGDTVHVEVERGDTVVGSKLTLARFVIPDPPTTPPLPGVRLRVTALPAADGEMGLSVTVGDVEDEGPFARAGLMSGDRVLRVDGLDALRFLDRHRYRPTTDLPAVVEVERTGSTLELRLGD